MRSVFRIFFIIYLFVASCCLNTFGSNPVSVKQSNEIQMLNSENIIKRSPDKDINYIVSSNTSENTVLFQKKDDYKFLFNGYRDIIRPDNNQFSLLISYIYNKSYLKKNIIPPEKIYLSQIVPNAP